MSQIFWKYGKSALVVAALGSVPATYAMEDERFTERSTVKIPFKKPSWWASLATPENFKKAGRVAVYGGAMVLPFVYGDSTEVMEQALSFVGAEAFASAASHALNTFIVGLGSQALYAEIDRKATWLKRSAVGVLGGFGYLFTTTATASAAFELVRTGVHAAGDASIEAIQAAKCRVDARYCE